MKDMLVAALTADDQLDDIARARMWAQLDDRLATPAPRRRALAWLAVGVCAAAAVVAVLVLVPRRDDAMIAPADATLTARVGPYTHASLVGPARLRVEGEPGARTTVHLERGTLLAEFAGGPGRALEIVAPGMRVAVVGTLFAVEVRATTTCVSVAHGRVQVTMDARAAVIATGEHLCTSEAAPTAIEPRVQRALEHHALVTADIGTTPELARSELVPGVAAPATPTSPTTTLTTTTPTTTTPATVLPPTTASTKNAPMTTPTTTAPTTPPSTTSLPPPPPPVMPANPPAPRANPPRAIVRSKTPAAPRSPAPAVASLPTPAAVPEPPQPTSSAPTPEPPKPEPKSEPAKSELPKPQPPQSEPPKSQPPKPAEPKPTGDQLYRSAEAALARHDVDAADRALATLIANEPTSPLLAQALYDRARIAYDRHAWAAARHDLDALATIKDTPLAESGRYLTCRIAVEAHDNVATRCLRDFRATYPRSPHDRDVLGTLAQLAHASGGCAAARTYIAELLQRYPHSTLATAWRDKCAEAK